MHVAAQRSRRAVVLAALCGLLLAQALALWHARLHRSGALPTASAVHAPQGQGDAWGHADGEASCRLVDQLLTGLGNAPPRSQDPATPRPLPPVPVAEGTVRAWGCRSSFQARAPPRA